MDIRFLITGHGRSGTNYMGALFRYLGYEVGSQQGGKHGMSHNFPDVWPFSVARKNYNYMIQVVRDPWKVAESTFQAYYSIPGVYSKYLTQLHKMSKVDKVISSIVLWNKAIDEAKPDLVVRVEEAETVCRKWLEDMSLPISGNGVAPPNNVNARKNQGWNLSLKVPWDKISDEYMKDFREHCRKYGYKDSCPDNLR